MTSPTVICRATTPLAVVDHPKKNASNANLAALKLILSAMLQTLENLCRPTEGIMTFLTKIPLSRKLPTVIAALCLTASVSIAVVGYLDFKKNIVAQARNSFQVLTESRGDALTAWFENTGQDVRGFATDPTVVSAMAGFLTTLAINNDGFQDMIDNAGLQDAYVRKNPYPAGERDQFDQAPEALPYHFRHGRYHPYFRQITQSAGYDDVFLFNLEGDLMYSVAKEADFATNFLSGPFAETGLAMAFSAARNGDAGALYFADFSAYAARGDAPASFIATPVSDAQGRIIGVFAIQLSISAIEKIVNNPIGLGQTGEVYVVGADLKTRSGSRFTQGHDVLDDVGHLAQAVDAMEATPAFMSGTAGIAGAPVLTMAAIIDVFGVRWGVIGEIALAEVNIPAINVRNKMIVITLVVAGAGVFLGWLTAQSVIRPLGRLGVAMQRVSEKEYDIALTEQHRRDEIGVLFRILIAFRDKLQASDAAEHENQLRQAEQAQVVQRLSTGLTRLADGDLMHEITTSFPDEYEQLRADYNRTLANLNTTIGSVVARAGVIRRRSDDMSRASDELSRRTENQAATLEETAAALDELTASVRSAATGAREVEAVVADARKDAEQSKPVVQNAVSAMTEIERSSEKISRIIGVIDDIAFQTNLLALNAGVEAARAGDAGRGFAVVASEVRALAQRSSDAAKQIKTLISESSGHVERGVGLVGQAGDVLVQIAAHIDMISGHIGEIAAGAHEQSTGLGEINIGVTQLDKVTQQNAAMVEQATTNSHSLNGDTGQLTELVTHFKLKQSLDLQEDRTDNIAMFVAQPIASRVAPDQTSHNKAVGYARLANGGVSARPTENFWQDF